MLFAACLAFSSRPHIPDAETFKKTIYIVRHGEKIDSDGSGNSEGFECLSNETNKGVNDSTWGWNRAEHLAGVFNGSMEELRPFNESMDAYADDYTAAKAKQPKALFSTNYANPVDCRDELGR